MPIKLSTLRTRSLTALVFLVVMLAGLWLYKWGFVLLCMVIGIGCFWEFIRLQKKIRTKVTPILYIAGLLYCILPMILLVDLGVNFRKSLTLHAWQDFVYSALFPCAIIFGIWINDTMAYLVGSAIGKTRLSSISPNKTVEGTLGGALLCVIIITLAASNLPISYNIAWYHWAIIAALTAIFGTLGDLLESKLKRQAGVKDSGKFMPGHGGFLDRFDSLLVSIPIVWLYISFVLGF